MTGKKLPQKYTSTSVVYAMNRASQIMNVTQGLLDKAKAARDISTQVDDSWIDRLYEWADNHKIPDLYWDEKKKIYRGLTRNRADLNTVTELHLFDCYVNELPPEIGQLTSLKELALGNNRLTELPPEIGQLTSLENLELGVNLLSELPPEIGQLTSLKKLDLNWTELTELPPEIGQLTSLEVLDLFFSSITELPPEIGQLTSLKNLDLNCTGLTELPLEIGQLTSLETLGIQNIESAEDWFKSNDAKLLLDKLQDKGFTI